jgi:hypothetical protein
MGENKRGTRFEKGGKTEKVCLRSWWFKVWYPFMHVFISFFPFSSVTWRFFFTLAYRLKVSKERLYETFVFSRTRVLWQRRITTKISSTRLLEYDITFDYFLEYLISYHSWSFLFIVGEQWYISPLRRITFTGPSEENNFVSKCRLVSCPVYFDIKVSLYFCITGHT